MVLVRILVFAAGMAIVGSALASAIRTFVLPRSVQDFWSAAVFVIIRQLFEIRLRWASSFEEKDRIMAFYAPVSLLALLPVWLALVLIGYMGMYWATGVMSLADDFTLSGSSLLTLGFAAGSNRFHVVLAFTEATIGLILVALLIAYLPTMYSAFSDREVAVAQLSGRAGTPPSALEMISRIHRIGELENLRDFWNSWERLFAEIEESHTSLTALVFFRSPLPEHSWITAAGAVMDTAALIASTVDVPRQAQAELCIRSGFLALRRIADSFHVEYDPDPHFPGEPISISREEFDAVYDQLAAEHVPLRPNREQAWLDFAGWRVNYDRVLLALCSLTMAPYAPWSSDRAPIHTWASMRMWARRP